MRERTIFFVGLILSVVLAALGYEFAQRPWDIINSILLLNLFILMLQLYFFMKDGDPAFGSSLQEIKGNPNIAPVLQELLAFIASTLRRGDSFLNDQLRKFLVDARAMARNLDAGALEVDFRPGGLFFREVDAVEHAARRMRATSFVEPGKYWTGAAGKQILQKCKVRIAAGVSVERIFIVEDDDPNTLATIMKQNQEIGVQVREVNASDVDRLMVRDFAILDEGQIAVELFLDRRTPVKAVYYTSAAEDGRRKIAELTNVWNSLFNTSQAI